MASFIEAVGESVNRAACLALGDFANRIEILRYVLQPLEGPGGSYNGAGALYAQRCGLPDPAVQPESPFVGGQCVSAPYRINLTFVAIAIPGSGQSDQNQTVNVNATGPITFVGTVDTGTARQVQVAAQTVNAGPSPGIIATFQKASFSSVTTTVNNIERRDGLPDNCGDPPPVIPPYTPGDNIVNENVTYVDNSNNSVTIPVVLAFGYATVNIDGTVNIPVNANFTLNPVLNANFNLNFNTGDVQPDVSNPFAPSPSPCSDPGGVLPDPSIPPPPASIPDAPPLPPPTTDPVDRERLLKGCIVTTSVLDGNESVIFQEDNPDIYVPSLGYVQFLIRVGNVSAWTNDLPVKSLRTFIPCPWDGGAIDVRGTPRFGNVFVVTPVYTTRTFNPTYPPES